MNLKFSPFIVLLTILVACQPKGLKEIYESEMKEIGNVGLIAIHVDERETFAIVIGAKDGKTSPSAIPFEKSGGDWQRQIGVSCDGVSSGTKLSGDLAIYCGTFTPERPYSKATVGTDEATIIELGAEYRVWYVVSQWGLKAEFSN